MDENALVESLLDEISMMTGVAKKKLDRQASLGMNHIDSMGFVRLMLWIKQQYAVDFVNGGLTAVDTSSVCALAERIEKEMKK